MIDKSPSMISLNRSSARLDFLATKMRWWRLGKVVTFYYPTGIEETVVQGVGLKSGRYLGNVSTYD